MSQKISELTSEHQEYTEVKRKWVKDHYDSESQHKYDSIEGKLVLLNTIIQNKWIRPDETVKLQNLGISFGDALAQKLNLKWKTIEDEYGQDPCLVYEGTSIVLFPLTMISKRIENGEEVDVYDMFNQFVNKIEEIKGKT